MTTMIFRAAIFTFVSLFALAPLAAGADSACMTPVATREGAVAGMDTDGVEACAWRGIPYAAAPVGDRRWRPPAPASARPSTFAATEFGPQCPQPRLGLSALMPSGPENEDCLFLNVWAPRKSGVFPVMVWVHGGDLLTGSGSVPIYLGERLAAEKDVVVVSINYRLGPMGFFYHPALAAEDPHGSAGNYGLMDQVAALRWVRDNITGFGGDPTSVTIFGESAGGWSVCHLLASPMATGLFHRAILQSGGCESSRTVGQGEAFGREFAARLGCAGAGPAAAECLRGKTAAQVIKAMGSDWQAMLAKFFPHVDGWALKASPLAALQAGEYNRVPLLVGSTRDEFRLFASEILLGRMLPAALTDRVIEKYMHADLEPQIGGLYPPSSHPRPADAMLEGIGDAYIGCPTWRAAETSSGYVPTFYYRFDYDDHSAPDMIGAAHGTEVPLVFDTGDREPISLLYTDGQWERAQPLAGMMRSYWTNFAATGDPNGPGLPAWPVYTADAPHRMRFDLPAETDRTDIRKKCEYWEKQPIVVH